MIQPKKRHLDVIGKEKVDNVVEGITCFSAHSKNGVDCQRKKCQHWIPYPTGHNCVMVAAGQGPHTLQEIGGIYGLTRMRICQIEKGIYEKIRNSA
jgi:hypothetical protein